MTRSTWPPDVRALLAPFRRNLLSKLFAGLFAFMLWFFVNAGKRETQVFQFPVELANVPGGAVLVNPQRIDSVAVRLNGPAPLLASLDARRAPIVLDLSSLEPGSEARLKVRDDLIRVPRGVRILDVEPSRVPVRLEPVAKATVPVHLAQMGVPPAGYRIESTTIAPAKVTITGPATVVQSVQTVETEPVDVSGLVTSAHRDIALVPREDSIVLKPERVTVQLTVTPIVVQRDYARVPVEVRNVDRPFQLRPPRVNLSVRGPERSVRALELGDGSVWVDGARLEVGEHDVQPQVTLPPDVELVKQDPTVLKLRIAPGEKKSEEKKGGRT
jgi:YbbR domain-containing protein